MLKKIFSSTLAVFIILLSFSPAFSLAEKNPLTIAESSNFTATSRYSDVMEFIKEVQKQSSLIRVETLCVSSEGRKVPLVIIGNPAPSSTLNLKHDKRAVIYFQANIHAGEVEGKEASLILMRDIIQKETPSYLDKLVILLAPIFNPDGNEKISPEHRRNQIGPEKGVGVRYNGQMLDLNRDSIKLESPELRGLVRNVLMRWDPILLVDCHTTNGSYHEEPVTYSWPLNPNGDTSIISYMRDKMMPSIAKNLKEKYSTFSIPYGNFMDYKNPEKGWSTFGYQARYVVNYVGLRNRLSILDENYAYADYKTRVQSCYNFLRSILDYCYEHKEEIQELVKKADQKTIQRGLNLSSSDYFAVEFEQKPQKDPISIKGWEMQIIPREKGWPRIKKTDKKRTYTLPYFCNFIPKRTVSFPYGYLIPIHDDTIIEKLLQHGIIIEQLTESTTLEVEAFKVKELKSSPIPYQGHHLNSIKGEYLIEKKEFPAGTLFVCTSQPLANLAAFLLEAENDDGLLAWNFFDRYLISQWGRELQIYPVYRVLTPVNFAKETLR